MTKNQLCEILCSLLGCKECSTTVLRQINKYVNQHGWTYLDIARAFAYFVEVEGNTHDPKYGIAIVPFKMEEAKKYYKQLEEQKERKLKAAKKAEEESKQQERKTIIVAQSYGPKGVRRKSIDIDAL